MPTYVGDEWLAVGAPGQREGLRVRGLGEQAEDAQSGIPESHNELRRGLRDLLSESVEMPFSCHADDAALTGRYERDGAGR